MTSKDLVSRVPSSESDNSLEGKIGHGRNTGHHWIERRTQHTADFPANPKSLGLERWSKLVPASSIATLAFPKDASSIPRMCLLGKQSVLPPWASYFDGSNANTAYMIRSPRLRIVCAAKSPAEYASVLFIFSIHPTRGGSARPPLLGSARIFRFVSS